MRKTIIFLTIIISIIGCHPISVDENSIQNIWITDGSPYFLLVKDSIILTDLYINEYKNNPISIFKIIQDTLVLRTKPDIHHRMPEKELRYLIEYFDTNHLTIREINSSQKQFLFHRLDSAKKNNLRIRYLEYSNMSCFGHCPSLDLKITEDSILYFYGYRHTKHKGLYKCKLKGNDINTLQKIINSIPIDSLFLIPRVPDGGSSSLFLLTDNDSVSISGNSINLKLWILLWYLEHIEYVYDLEKVEGEEFSIRDTSNKREAYLRSL